MATLISLLGRNTSNAQTGYEKTNYRFDDGFSRAVPYFALALLEHTKPDKLVLLGTAGSMWDVFFDQQQVTDDNVLALMAAADKARVTAAMLATYEPALSHKLGVPVQCLLIPYATSDAEQAQVLSVLADCVQPGEQVMLDVTHGFRHLPMLALVAARYLGHVQNVEVQEIFYGALQMTNPDTGETPVLRLGGLLRMLDWVEALAAYDKSGNYGIFGQLLANDGLPQEQARELTRGAFYERCNNPAQARPALSGALTSIQEHQGTLGKLFKSTLEEQIGWFRHGSRADWELALSDRYLARQDYIRGVSYLYESFVSHAVINDRGDPNDFDDRKYAFDNVPKNQDIWLLTHLRNALAHGVRSENKDVTRLLKNQEALDDKLRHLRKKLFTK